MGSVISDFKDLIIWQKAISFAKEVYRLSQNYPKEERYGLRSQTRNSAVSVSSNIAEGHARQGREFSYFLSIARGSLAECESQLLFAVEVKYLDFDDLKLARSLASEIRRMASSLSAKIGAAQLEKVRLGSVRHRKILTPDP